MRVMVIVKADKNSEAGMLPKKELFEKMGKYNEELVKAGIMLAVEGLQATSKGKRVKFLEGKRNIPPKAPISESTPDVKVDRAIFLMRSRAGPRRCL